MIRNPLPKQSAVARACKQIRSRPRSLLAIIVILLILAFGFLSARSRDDVGDAPPCPSAVSPVDKELLAYLSKARAAHHAADLHEQAGQLGAAIHALRSLAATDADPPSRPEAREILADTFARLADLESQRGNFKQSRDDVRAGLKLATEPTYYRGHLLEVLGVAEQRHYEMLTSLGDERSAKQAKERALEAFNGAIRVQQVVIERAMKNHTSSGSP